MSTTSTDILLERKQTTAVGRLNVKCEMVLSSSQSSIHLSIQGVLCEGVGPLMGQSFTKLIPVFGLDVRRAPGRNKGVNMPKGLRGGLTDIMLHPIVWLSVMWCSVV